MIADEVIRNDWHVVHRSADLADGEVRKVHLLGKDLAVWRTGGHAMAWLDLCIHRGSRFTMGRVEDGKIVCPYHGWRYGPSGQCTLIPSQPDVPVPKRARAITYHCKEQYGLIWVCMGEPSDDIPTLPEWEDPEFVNVHTGPYAFSAAGPRVVENVLDVTHFPFVHADFLGASSEPDKIGAYEVRREADGLRTSPIRVFQPVADHRRIPVETTYTFWCPRPLIGYLMKTIDEERRFSHFMPITPVNDVECILWVLTSANYEKDDAEARIKARNDEIFAQDKVIVENQRPAQIPLDLKQELHVRADKLHVAYRRWLHDLGVTTEAA